MPLSASAATIDSNKREMLEWRCGIGIRTVSKRDLSEESSLLPGESMRTGSGGAGSGIVLGAGGLLSSSLCTMPSMFLSLSGTALSGVRGALSPSSM